MAQSDRTVNNATFPAVRADINDKLDAIFSQHSGPSAPPDPIIYQPWIDTSTSPATWKVFNGVGQWVVIGTINTTTLEFKTGGVTAIANGGTGQTTASNAINALLPSQSGNASKYLTTNGTVASWAAAFASQVFEYTSDNTWTKPSQGNFALVTIWGGGGSGGRNTGGAGGGGGGACVQRLYRLSELPASVAITIGLGGAGQSTDGDGNPGGNTTFGALLTAYGGGGGQNSGSTFTPVAGGGGGGSLGVGTTSAAGAGHGPSLAGALGSTAIGQSADFGGAGGGGNGNGGNAYWGGGGGGGKFVATNGTGGISLHGGNGGNAVTTTGQAGAVPGGGGGGSDGTSGAGGNGLCLIYVW